MIKTLLKRWQYELILTSKLWISVITFEFFAYLMFQPFEIPFKEIAKYYIFFNWVFAVVCINSGSIQIRSGNGARANIKYLFTLPYSLEKAFFLNVIGNSVNLIVPIITTLLFYPMYKISAITHRFGFYDSNWKLVLTATTVWFVFSLLFFNISLRSIRAKGQLNFVKSIISNWNFVFEFIALALLFQAVLLLPAILHKPYLDIPVLAIAVATIFAIIFFFARREHLSEWSSIRDYTKFSIYTCITLITLHFYGEHFSNDGKYQKKIIDGVQLSENCQSGGYNNPSRTYSVLVSCNATTNSHSIATFSTKPTKSFSQNHFIRPKDRVWQETAWSQNVDSFSWGLSDDSIIVTGNGIKPWIYHIDLRNRVATDLSLKSERFPASDINSNSQIEIIWVNRISGKIKLAISKHQGQSRTKVFRIIKLPQAEN